MSYVFPPAAQVAVPVVGLDAQFPVRRIYCVGRNYEAHAREMGHDPDREPPFFFCKPADAVVYVAPGTTGQFPYPPQSQDVHHEMELVAAIGQGGRLRANPSAMACSSGEIWRRRPRSARPLRTRPDNP